MPEHRSIGELAYRLWQSRGCPEGTAERDWLDAERQLLATHGTFPADDPASSHAPDQPPANTDAKRKAAAAPKKPPRRSSHSSGSSGSSGSGSGSGSGSNPDNDATR